MVNASLQRHTECWRPLVLLLLAALAAGADEAPVPNPISQKIIDEAHRLWVGQELAAWRKQFPDETKVRVRPGIMANRTTREVEVLAAGCGLVNAVPTEFFLVGENGRDYEAVAVTTAKAADLLAALRFIGLAPGQPIDPAACRFWPKGERVVLTYHWEDVGPDGKTTPQALRAEDSILDTRTNKPLPPAGLVFVGSCEGKREGDDGQPITVLEAEVTGNFAANFNDRWTLLDVPYLGNQGELYGRLVPNPDHLFRFGQRLRVRLKPELPAGETRVREFRLAVGALADRAVAATPDLRFTLTPVAGGPVALERGDFDALLAALQALVKANKDVHAQVAFARELPLAPVAEFCAMLRVLGERGVLRQEPAAGEFYVEALLPKPEWRDRSQRLSQPIELHLAAAGGAAGPRGDFVFIREEFAGEEVKLTEERFPFAGKAALQAVVAKREDWDTTTIFYYPPAGATYGQVLDLHAALGVRFPVAYILAPVQ